jgi:ubiquinone/menaquinone biosynthesis C-methylase UbiE
MTDQSTYLKEEVKSKYAEIAVKSNRGCGCGCSGEPDPNDFTEDYKKLDGYVKEADLGLGCGIPTEFAEIKKGDVVVDLGSGAGNDVFVARSIVGDEGEVIGIDFTEEMINMANRNLSKLGYKNVSFKFGDIENLPLEDNSANVVISNCVLNLVPDKKKAFTEIYRVLKKGGHFCVSDIVTSENLPNKLKEVGELYAGCVSGAIKQNEYIGIINSAGFKDVSIKRSKENVLPDDYLLEHVSVQALDEFRKSKAGLFSVTVVGYKR